MKTLVLSFFTSLISILAIDVVWLFTMAKRFYAHHLGSIMSETPNLLPAGIFYLIYALGLSVFIILPALQNNTGFLRVFLLGAFFGLIAYATYDLSNQATLKNWPLIVTLVDLLWGSLLTASVSVITVFIVKYFS